MTDRGKDKKKRNDGGRGRCSLYYERLEEHLPRIKQLAKMGYNDAQIAAEFGVPVNSFSKYRRVFEDLNQSILEGKREAVAPIIGALYKRAEGFTQQVDELVAVRDGNDQVIRHDVKRVNKYFAPDMGAIRMWLKYQAPDRFGERVRSIPEDLALMGKLNKQRKEENWSAVETSRAYEELGVPLPESLRMEMMKELKETITAPDNAQIKIVLPSIEDTAEAEDLIERFSE